jgi:excisionase family DNA binding protein
MTLDDPLVTTDEAAQVLRTNPRTMERWRSTGEGPAFVKVGRRVAYSLSALREWVHRQTRQHTRQNVA